MRGCLNPPETYVSKARKKEPRLSEKWQGCGQKHPFQVIGLWSFSDTLGDQYEISLCYWCGIEQKRIMFRSVKGLSHIEKTL